MLCLVCYDIEDDYLRLTLSKLLIRLGLERVQKSVFMGMLKKSDRENLQNWCRQHIDPEAKVHVMIVPMKSTRNNAYWHFGNNEPDWDFLTNNCETLLC